MNNALGRVEIRSGLQWVSCPPPPIPRSFDFALSQRSSIVKLPEGSSGPSSKTKVPRESVVISHCNVKVSMCPLAWLGGVHVPTLRFFSPCLPLPPLLYIVTVRLLFIRRRLWRGLFLDYSEQAICWEGYLLRPKFPCKLGQVVGNLVGHL